MPLQTPEEIAAAEAAYDAAALSQRSYTQLEAPEPHDALTAIFEQIDRIAALDAQPEVPASAPAIGHIMPLAEQLSQAPRNEQCSKVKVGALASGETLIRYFDEGAPCEWIDVAYGAADMSIQPGGTITDIGMSGESMGGCFEGLNIQHLRDLHALLGHTLDHIDELARLAQLDPITTAERDAWMNLPYHDLCLFRDTIGFVEWSRRRQAGQPIHLDELVKPMDGGEQGDAAAQLVFLLRRLDGDRARQFARKIEDALNLEPAVRNDLVDSMIAAAP